MTLPTVIVVGGGLIDVVVMMALAGTAPGSAVLTAVCWILGIATAGALLFGASRVWAANDEAVSRHMQPTRTSRDSACNYLGWDGAIQSFRISSQEYAELFLLANWSKAVNIPTDVRLRLQNQNGSQPRPIAWRNEERGV